jgi:hypothetical protein
MTLLWGVVRKKGDCAAVHHLSDVLRRLSLPDQCQDFPLIRAGRVSSLLIRACRPAGDSLEPQLPAGWIQRASETGRRMTVSPPDRCSSGEPVRRPKVSPPQVSPPVGYVVLPMPFCVADLTNVDKQIAIALERLSRQRKIVSLLRTYGLDTAASERLLASIERTLEGLMDHRRLVEEDLGNADV